LTFYITIHLLPYFRLLDESNVLVSIDENVQINVNLKINKKLIKTYNNVEIKLNKLYKIRNQINNLVFYILRREIKI